jgi:hypothetical protein
MKHLLFYITISSILGCTADEQSDLRSDPLAIDPLSDENGIVTAQLDPSGATQKLAASTDSAIDGSEVFFPPGALSLPTRITLEEGASLDGDEFYGNLGQSGLQSTRTGAAVVVDSSAGVDPMNPLVLALPIPGLNLLAVDYKYLAVLYKHRVFATDSYKDGIIPASNLQIDQVNGKVIFSSGHFGSFQVVLLNKVVTAEEKPSTTPIETKAEEEADQDLKAPVPGSSGVLATSESTTTSLKLSWTKASDNMSPHTAMLYRVYQSGSNNISKVADLEKNGTPVGEAKAGITSLTISGLSLGTSYYLNVLVTDEAGNKAVYATKLAATVGDIIEPTVDNKTITATESTTSVALSWNEAEDSVTSQENLIYNIYASTVADDVELDTLDATAFKNKVTGQATYTVQDLQPETLYYFNVIAQDLAGNKIAYQLTSVTTLSDNTAPTVDGGSLLVDNNQVGTTKVAITWSPAFDDVSSQSDIVYKVCYAMTEAEVLDPVDFDSCSPDVLSPGVTTAWVEGLIPGTVYYINVAAEDEVGNRAVYTPLMVETEVAHVAFVKDPTGSASIAVHAENTGGSWALSGDRATFSGGTFNLGLALDSMGLPHLCLRDTDHSYYTYRDGGGIWAGNLDYYTTGTQGLCVIDVDLNNDVHIYSLDDDTLFYANNASGTMELTGTPETGAGLYLTAAIPHGGTNMYACVKSSSLSEVNCYLSTSAGTIYDDILGTGDYKWLSMNFDSGNTIHMAYYEYTSGLEGLRYAKKNNLPWDITPIAEGSNTGYLVRMAVGPDDSIHMVYVDSISGDLFYNYGVSGTFQDPPSLVASNIGTTTDGSRIAIAVDNTNTVHIVYQDVSNKTIKYKYGTYSDGWTDGGDVYVGTSDTGVPGDNLDLKISK